MASVVRYAGEQPMGKILLALLVCLTLTAGCASSSRMSRMEDTGKAHQDLLQQTDRRLRALEQGMAGLEGRMAQLDARKYEVRTRGGKNTGLTVVPLPLPPQESKTPADAAPKTPAPSPAPQAAAAPAPSSAGQASSAPTSGPTAGEPAAHPASPPAGRIIDPAAPPHPLTGAAAAPAKASAPPASAAPTEKQKARRATPSGTPALPAPAGATGSAGPAATPPGPSALGLPPESAPPESPQAPAQNTPPAPAANGRAHAANGQDVPVPVLPAANLPLPPESPSLGLPPTEAPPAPAAASASTTPPASPPTPAPASAPPAPPAGPAVPASAKGEAAAYQAALRPALAGRAAESIPLFENFLQQYPQGRYAANAQYWIGEGLYSQGKYQEALARFRQVDADWPRHHKNADALLKTGMTLARLGDREGAAQAYKKVLDQFPSSEAAGKVRARGLAR